MRWEVFGFLELGEEGAAEVTRTAGDEDVAWHVYQAEIGEKIRC